MPSPELNAMSKEQLVDLQVRVDHEIERRDQERRMQARKEVERIAAEAGLSVDEILGKSRKKSGGAKAKLAPKYRHPENPSLTWVGRGKQPDWFKEALNNGTTKEDLLIKKQMENS